MKECSEDKINLKWEKRIYHLMEILEGEQLEWKGEERITSLLLNSTDWVDSV